MTPKGLFINDVMLIWTFSDPTPTSASVTLIFLTLMYLFYKRPTPFPHICVTSFINDPEPDHILTWPQQKVLHRHFQNNAAIFSARIFGLQHRSGSHEFRPCQNMFQQFLKKIQKQEQFSSLHWIIFPLNLFVFVQWSMLDCIKAFY